MSSKIKVLFLAANPQHTSGLSLGQEFRAISNEVIASRHRESLELVSAWSTQTEDLLRTLNLHQPHIVHFSGHGTEVGEILLEDVDGKAQPVSPEALKRLFKTLKDNVRLVFLNACFSRVQAEAITEVIDCAIGMNTRIQDNAAINFATTVYGAIANGRSIQNAFDQGVSRLDLDRMLAQDIPQLLVRRGVDADRVVLVGPATVSDHGYNTRHARVPQSPTPPKREKTEKQFEPPWTNPTGRSYLSYHRSRAHEAELLIAAQHDRGILTFHDLANLEEEQSEKRIRRMLADSGTANAILWLTPEVKSDSLRQLETASIFERLRLQEDEDSFFVCPLAAGGLDLSQLRSISLEDLGEWNPRKIKVDPIGPTEAAEVARRVLKQRLAAIHAGLPEGEPLRVQFFTRPSAALAPGTALLIDWIDRFEGRVAKAGNWERFLLPALADVAHAVQTEAFERVIEVSGLVSIPAATALGCVFLAPRGLNIGWRQPSLGRDAQLWTLYAERESSGFRADFTEGDPNSRDVAVLVSVAANVEPAFKASLENLPSFGTIIRVGKPGPEKHDLPNAEQAGDVAQVVIEGIRHARHRSRRMGCIHLFMSVPVGLAMMIGQLLNTLESVQTYEHIPSDGVGYYTQAALLHPSGGSIL